MQFIIMWIPADGSHNCESKVRRKENYCRQFFGLPLHSDVQYTNLYTGSKTKMLRANIVIVKLKNMYNALTISGVTLEPHLEI